MSQLRVKVCGITRADDADAAVALGAAAIGFIFWPNSPRFVDPYRARRIATRLPAFVTAVGVFVNQPVEYMNAVASLVGLAAVQLHGDETPDTAIRLKRPVIRALSGSGIVEAGERWPTATVLLVDAHDPVQRGGTGRTADWTQAARLAGQRRVLLSGGLHAGNVAAAVAMVRPFGIDVSSGVEVAPGVKDHDKLAAFFAQLRTAAADPGHTGVAR